MNKIVFGPVVAVLILFGCGDRLLPSCDAQTEAANQSLSSTAQELERFLEVNTYAFLHVDLDQFDPSKIQPLLDSAKQNVLRLLPFYDRFSELTKIDRLLLGDTVNKVKLAGGRDAFVFFSLSHHVHPEPVLVIVATTNEQAKQIQAITGPKSFVTGRSVVLGTPRFLQRIRQNQFPTRRDASELLATIGPDALSFVLSPSQDQRRAIREIVQHFPTPFQSVTGAEVADGLHSICIRIPNLKAPELRVQFNGTAPDGFKTFTQSFLRSVGRHKNRKTTTPPLDLMTLSGKLFSKTKPIINANSIVFRVPQNALVSLQNSVSETADKMNEHRLNELAIHSFRQVVIATHNYMDATKKFPARQMHDSNRQPLLSWRVHLLPFCGYQALYQRFHLDEPWDSPHNIKLVPEIPKFYQVPEGWIGDRESKRLTAAGKTIHLMPRGSGTFEDAKQFSDILGVSDKKASSRTIMYMAVLPKHAVIWTQPNDVTVDLGDPSDCLFDQASTRSIVAFCNGEAQIIGNDIRNARLREWFTLELESKTKE